jgi:hypothetical protein
MHDHFGHGLGLRRSRLRRCAVFGCARQAQLYAPILGNHNARSQPVVANRHKNQEHSDPCADRLQEPLYREPVLVATAKIERHTDLREYYSMRRA